MLPRIRKLLGVTAASLAMSLEKANVIERERLRVTSNLAWPRIVTGFARMSKQTADVAMVGLVVGPSAIAGLAFAYAYWQIGNRVSLGLSGGTISLVSQHFGAERSAQADRVITQSYLLATAFALPIAVVFYFRSELLIEYMGAAPEAIEYGSAYLTVLAPALVFEYYNKVASRVFAGVGDTLTPMIIRAGGATLNIVFNVALIFGLGLGVVGAAIGTVVSTVLITIVFTWGLLGKSYLSRDPLPVGLMFSWSVIDATLLRSLFTVSVPLMLQELARAVVVFPLLAIAAVFGSVTVAAYEIARRIRDLINAPAWGFAIAASSLVGQHLGADQEGTAAAYGVEIVRLSLLTFVLLSVVVLLSARPIARVFVSDPKTITKAAPFIRVGAVATIGLGLDKTFTGALRGAGDTRWPFYGALVGLYVFTLPIAYMGVLTSLGVTALYLSLLVEAFVPALITAYRYRTDAWRGVSQSLRDAATD